MLSCFPYLAIEYALYLLPYLSWTLLWEQPFPCRPFEWKHLRSRLGNGFDILFTPHSLETAIPPLWSTDSCSFTVSSDCYCNYLLTSYCLFSFKIHFKIWALGSHPSSPSCCHPAWLYRVCGGWSASIPTSQFLQIQRLSPVLYLNYSSKLHTPNPFSTPFFSCSADNLTF